MIKSITIPKEYPPFWKSYTIPLGQVTLLVGDQGSGKSTILNMVTQGTGLELDGPMNFRKLDTEQDNPRVGAGSMNPLYNISVLMQSHGQVMLTELKYIMNTAQKGDIILLDEPESGLSLRSQDEIADVIWDCTKCGVQVLIATHSQRFIEIFGYENTFNLETMSHLKDVSELWSKESKTKLDKRLHHFNDSYIKKYQCSMGTNCICTKDSHWYNNKCDNYVGRGGNKRYKKVNQKIK